MGAAMFGQPTLAFASIAPGLGNPRERVWEPDANGMRPGSSPGPEPIDQAIGFPTPARGDTAPVQTSASESLSTRLEQFSALDPLSERLQSLADRVIPEESRAKDLLSGTWLGHPLHP